MFAYLELNSITFEILPAFVGHLWHDNTFLIIFVFQEIVFTTIMAKFKVILTLV
jgi:hypothetical protein